MAPAVATVNNSSWEFYFDVCCAWTLSAAAIMQHSRQARRPRTGFGSPPRTPPLLVLCSKLAAFFFRRSPLSFHASPVKNARPGENYMVGSLKETWAYPCQSGCSPLSQTIQGEYTLDPEQPLWHGNCITICDLLCLKTDSRTPTVIRRR